MPDLYTERASRSIDDAWIKGVRKAWKQWYKKVQALEAYRVKSSEYSNDWPDEKKYEVGRELVRRETARITPLFNEGLEFVHRLRNDLLVNKFLWTGGDPNGPGDNLKEIREFKEKLLKHLDAARKSLGDWAIRLEDGLGMMLDPGQGQFFRKDLYDDIQRLLNSPVSFLKEGAKGADSEISNKLLRHLGKWVKKAGGELDFGTGEAVPDSVEVGSLRIVFLDSPKTKADLKRTKGGRHPIFRKYYIKDFKKAQTLLNRRGLRKLWYGKVVVRPSSLAPENYHGASFGVGGTYHRKGDFVTLYQNPGGTAQLIIHELGHRYYYKFMSRTDRMNFDKWFGKVAATSKYGGTEAAEDFAEVFRAYVMGEDLSRDQIDRFKAVLGRKRKLEDVEELMQRVAAIEESYWSARLDETIKKTPKGYVIFSKKGKKLSRFYKNKEDALKRLRQIEFFKHKSR